MIARDLMASDRRQYEQQQDYQQERQIDLGEFCHQHLGNIDIQILVVVIHVMIEVVERRTQVNGDGGFLAIQADMVVRTDDRAEQPEQQCGNNRYLVMVAYFHGRWSVIQNHRVGNDTTDTGQPLPIAGLV